MNLHSAQRYPLLKYLYEDLTYAFYKTETALINRLLILYHNRNTLCVDDQTGDFVREFQEHVHRQKFHFARLFDRERLCKTRERVLFLLENNRSIIDKLLTRADYTSPIAKNEAFLNVFQWLSSADYHGNSLISDWLAELPALIRKSDREMLSINKPVEIPMFHTVLTGSDEDERQVKFEKLVASLIDEGWIVPSSQIEKFDYKLPKAGGRLHLAALFHCLNQRGHLRKIPDGLRLADMFKNWLVCEVSRESLAKSFQFEEQRAFECGVNDKRYKYLEAAMQIIIHFENQMEYKKQ